MPNPVKLLCAAAPSESVTLLHRAAKGKGALACWMAIPAHLSEGAMPLVAVHGIRRGAKQQAGLFAARAAELGRPVIAPLFDNKNWPNYQQPVHRKRADLALLDLMAELRLAGLWNSRKFELSGYSGGAQFAHRFTMLYPHLVARLSVASAGWYSFPDAAAFPYGLSESEGKSSGWGPRFAAGLQQFLSIPIQISVGEEDCVWDPNTRHGKEIDLQQGKDRLTRARRWAAALREAAQARGMTAQVHLTVLPDCGHDFQDCVRKGGLDRIVLPGSPETDDKPAQTLPREPAPMAAAEPH